MLVTNFFLVTLQLALTTIEGLFQQAVCSTSGLLSVLRVRTLKIEANLEKIRYQQNSFSTPSGWYGGLPKNSFTIKHAGKKSYASFPEPHEKYVFSEEYYPVSNSLRSIFDTKCVKIEGI